MMCQHSNCARIDIVIFPTFAMEDDQSLVKSAANQSPPTARDDRTVAVVAPQWLQDGLAVVIKTIPYVHLVACTGSIHVLLSLDLERSPDLMVLTVDAPDVKASNQIRQVKFVYPHARYLVLIQEQEQSASARAAGADETLLQGASAEQFCAAVSQLVWEEQVEKDTPETKLNS
jgi:DNA-binding NarL/FixJ family response regulator